MYGSGIVMTASGFPISQFSVKTGSDGKSLTLPFQLLGEEIADSRRYYVLALKPKSKSPYLVKGKAWIDANEYALARLEGVVAKKPSIWAGSPVLRQTYMKSGPFWLPEKNLAFTNAPVFGNTDLAIESSGYEIRRGPAVEAAGSNSGN